MMPRRLLGPVGRWLMFLLVAGLVVGGLGWVSYASLGVESAQRTAAAAADRSGKERLALWRLDGKLLPTLGAENFRSFEHFTAIYSSVDVTNSIYQNAQPGQLTANTALLTQEWLSPLAVEELEPWLLLHAQLDPDNGWLSPQVIPPEKVDQLRNDPNFLYLAGVTDERRKLLAELNRVLPARETAQKLADLDGGGRNESSLPVLLADSMPIPLDRATGRDLPGMGNTRRTITQEFFAWLQNGSKSAQPGPNDPMRVQLKAGEPLPPKVMPPAAGLQSAIPDVTSQKANDQYAVRPVQGGTTNNTQLAQNPTGNQFNNPDTDAQKRANLYKTAGPPGRGAQTGPPLNNTTPDAAMPPGGMTQNGTVSPTAPKGPGETAPTTPSPAPATGAPAGPGGPPPAPGMAGRQFGGTGGPAPSPASGTTGAPGGGGTPAATSGGFGAMPAGPGGFGGGGGKDGTGRSGPAGRPGEAPEKKPDEKAGTRERNVDPKQDAGEKKLEEKVGEDKADAGAAKDQKGSGANLDRKEVAPPLPAPATKPVTPGQPEARELNQFNKSNPTDLTRTAKEQFGKLKLEQAIGRDEALRLRAADNEVAKKEIPSTRRPPPVGVHLGTMRPVWLTDADGNPRLLFARAATMANNKTIYQTIVIDWPTLREALLAEVTDLFPAAALTPILAGDPVAPERTMAALPAELDLGPAPVLPPAGWTPLRIGLALGWVAALVALAAVWFGGWSLVDLSERRIRFVSAVTHELRTPLTSLRLYLDMLTAGMIKEEQKKQEYLATLSTESDRLNRLIENVLDFSRLERRNAKAVRESVPVADLLARVKETWTERVAADGKVLHVMAVVPPAQTVTVDPRMVEQILGNLVDNARKYTREAADPRIWVWAKPAGRRCIAFEVEDRGPGIPVAERRSIFRPFRRGSEADTTAGGAGLGLALAKQWAELCGGRLNHRPAEGGTGACFRLELPVG